MLIRKKQVYPIIIVKTEGAVKAGLITAEFLKAERERLGPLYN